LAQFQKRVLDVEADILRKDASYVGAYNIVPLTTIVGQFSGWTKRMEWFWEVTQYMLKDGCTGAKLINSLIEAMRTGYQDIEEAALSLLKVAEIAWLKQASSWILYGRLPAFGQADFFIQCKDGDHNIVAEHLPTFVSVPTAASILFIGRSINQLCSADAEAASSIQGLVGTHRRILSQTDIPITSANLASTISHIRRSLSLGALQKLLPLDRVQEILHLLHEYFLLNNGEFSSSLITEADEKSTSRWKRNKDDDKGKLKGMMMKDNEVTAVLTRTWGTLSALQGLDSDDGDMLELGRDLMELQIMKASKSATPFNSILLPIPTGLTLKVASPLNLFLSSKELGKYTSVNSFLLSIRRAHLRLSDLWKLSALRRVHPSPPSPPFDSTPAGKELASRIRERSKFRDHKMRSVWATSSAALYFVAELEAYFHIEIIQYAWDSLQQWIREHSQDAQGPTDTSPTASGHDEREQFTRTPAHDPQSLALAHGQFLQYVGRYLLISTSSFTQPLFTLLKAIDHLVALVYRIQTIWAALDLETDEGVVDAFSDFHKEEGDVAMQLAEAADTVKLSVQKLLASLRDLDQNSSNDISSIDDIEAGVDGIELIDADAFKLKESGRLDRLLMKLDFGGWLEPSNQDMEC
jgi:hypothetical protein